MAEPFAPPAGGGAKPGGGLLPKDPKQRRMLLAVAGAAVLALIVMMRGRAGAPAEDGQPAGTIGPAPSTFADNGESAGALGTSISDAAGQLAQAADQLGTQTAAQQDAFAGALEQLRTVNENEPAVTAAPSAPAAPSTSAEYGMP